MLLGSITCELRKSNLETKLVQMVKKLCLDGVGIVGIVFQSRPFKLHGQKFLPQFTSLISGHFQSPLNKWGTPPFGVVVHLLLHLEIVWNIHQ
jgi:hypothetical protein